MNELPIVSPRHRVTWRAFMVLARATLDVIKLVASKCEPALVDIEKVLKSVR